MKKIFLILAILFLSIYNGHSHSRNIIDLRNFLAIEIYGSKLKIEPKKYTTAVINVANDDPFITDINLIIQDAKTGFKLSKGPFKSDYYRTREFSSNLSIFNDYPAAAISLREEYYTSYNGETHPKEVKFSQGFESKNPNGLFAYENSERICDNLAVKLKLKKRTEKENKKDDEKDRHRNVIYSERGRKVLELVFYKSSEILIINVHSDVDLVSEPKYAGCMVLYYMQAGKPIYARNYFIYDDNMVSQDELYQNILKRMSSDYKESYKNYEWLPYVSKTGVGLKMADLNLKYEDFKINSEGFLIK